MSADQIVEREEIARLAAEDAREWVAGGRRGSIANRYPALSMAAKLYDAALKRALGSDDEEGEA